MEQNNSAQKNILDTTVSETTAFAILIAVGFLIGLFMASRYENGWVKAFWIAVGLFVALIAFRLQVGRWFPRKPVSNN